MLPYIVKGGILPYHFLKTTDYRGLYVDIDLQSYFRCKPPDISPVEYRILQSPHPRHVKKYTQSINQWLNTTKFEEKVEKLQDEFLRAEKITGGHRH